MRNKKLAKISGLSLIIFITYVILSTGSFIIIESNSMYPSISRGDIIFVLKEKQYNIGDIITFTYNNQTYTHRIILTEGKKYKTKGDASMNLDFWKIENKNIFGKLIFKIPFVGNINLWLNGK